MCRFNVNAACETPSMSPQRTPYRRIDILLINRCPWPSKREEKKPEPTPFEKWLRETFGSMPREGTMSFGELLAAWDAALAWKKKQDALKKLHMDSEPCVECWGLLASFRHYNFCPNCGRKYTDAL